MGTPNVSATKLRIAILGSGKGTTAEAVLEWEGRHDAAFRTVRLICTSEASGMVGVGDRHDCPVCVVPYTTEEMFGTELVAVLREDRVDLLVLAGFLKLLPASVISAMDGRVVNTHPALLPRFGGPGMFGLHVHRAVLDAGESETGVSVHWVTERYDEGAVIAQKRVNVVPGDTPEALQERVKQVEGGFLAYVVDQLARTSPRPFAKSG